MLGLDLGRLESMGGSVGLIVEKGLLLAEESGGRLFIVSKQHALSLLS